MCLKFYEVKENKYIVDDRKLLFVITGEFNVSETEEGLINIKTKIDNIDYSGTEMSINDIKELKIELTLSQDGNYFKRGIPKFTIEDYETGSFNSEFTFIFKPCE